MYAEWCLWLIHCIMVIIGFDTFGWSIYFSNNITPRYWHYHSHLRTQIRVGMNYPILYLGFEIGLILNNFEFISSLFLKGKNIVKKTYLNCYDKCWKIQILILNPNSGQGTAVVLRYINSKMKIMMCLLKVAIDSIQLSTRGFR